LLLINQAVFSMHNELSATLLAAMILFARVNMPIFLELLGTARRTRVSHDHSCLLASGYRLVGVPTIPRTREHSITSITLPTTARNPAPDAHRPCSPDRCLEIAMGAGWNLRRVLDHHDFHPFGALLQQSHALGRGLREIDDAALTAPVGSTVIDFDDHLLLRAQIRDLHLGPQG
jgi:hypothetical protein